MRFSSLARARLPLVLLAALAGGSALAQPPAAETEASEPYVRPDVAKHLEAFYARPIPTLTREMLVMIHNLPREQAGGFASLDLPVGEMAVAKDLEMPGPGGAMRLQLFDPKPDREPGSVVVFYHGGGYVLGSIETHAGLAAEIARRLDLPVVSVDYRLAPEHPFPAAIEDGEAAARWIAENGAAMGREVTGLVLAGDSAGGNLALVTAATLRDAPAAVPVVMQIPIYPATDFTSATPSMVEFAKGYGLDSEGTEKMVEFYAADPTDLRASPLLGDLAGLPPTVLVTASLDPMRDQGRAYGAKLIESGVPTLFYEGEGLVHGFATFRKSIPSAAKDTAEFLDLAKAMLEASGSGATTD